MLVFHWLKRHPLVLETAAADLPIVYRTDRFLSL